jgi:uncharacterized protein (DUF427 family)
MDQSGYVDRPDYRVDVLARRNRVTASLGDTVLAESTACLLVDEQDHGIVFYFPREDVHLEHLEATDTTSRCPYKGSASYWRAAEGERDIAWTYDEPYAEVARIKGFVAFYQDRVQVAVGVAKPAVSGRA